MNLEAGHILSARDPRESVQQPDCWQTNCREPGMGINRALQAVVEDKRPDCEHPPLPQACLHVVQSTSPVGDKRPDSRCLHMTVPPREQAYEEEFG